MRAVRVVGLAEDGREVVVEDVATREQFLLPRDDRLRAAARGDLSRFGKPDVKVPPAQMRPREIQARIRAGASVDEIALLANTSPRRIETFAHPVLLERTTVAEKARRARPAIDGITSTQAVEDAVAATLAARGHSGSVSWDAFRDDHVWVLALTWQVGCSENRAHWTFHPGSDGGTLSARDDAAADIVNPAVPTLRPLSERAAAPAIRPAASTVGLFEAAGPSTSTDMPSQAPTEVPGPAPDHSPDPRADQQDLVEKTVPDPRAGVEPVTGEVIRTGTDNAPATHPATPRSGRSARRGNRPVMPSWEDVLLGSGARPSDRT